MKCNRILSAPISLPFKADSSEAFEIAIKRSKRVVGSNTSDITCKVYRRSIDARKKNDIRFVYTILLEFTDYITVDEETIHREGFRSLPPHEINLHFGYEEQNGRPLIVGSGPAGMFCTLMLAEHGYRPILIDRGGAVDERVRSVNNFFQGGALDINSNVMFGAGGAGTFSDGKLVTRISDPLCGYVFERLCDFGAPADILYKAKPHIGTDLLQTVVDKLHEKIKICGGDVIYHCKLNAIRDNSKGITALTSNGDINASCIVLAIGHSSRDTYKYLNDNGYSLSVKPFSVGVRIEHLRSDIESALYGDYAGDPLLGAAEYALSDTAGGRGVYTFCMCPGGQVIAAASEQGGVVVNGMSCHARDKENSNSAVAVSVLPSDYVNTPMGAVEFQRLLEQRAFTLGGGDYSAPVELLGDFLSDKTSGLSDPRAVKPSYTRGVTQIADISRIFPQAITDELKRGFKSFGKKIRGFDAPHAVMTAVESRTSAPIRILRNENGCALGHDFVYPCGEGAGYAGGITSAAVDGIKTALQIMKRFAIPKD